MHKNIRNCGIVLSACLAGIVTTAGSSVYAQSDLTNAKHLSHIETIKVNTSTPDTNKHPITFSNNQDFQLERLTVTSNMSEVSKIEKVVESSNTESESNSDSNNIVDASVNNDLDAVDTVHVVNSLGSPVDHQRVTNRFGWPADPFTGQPSYHIGVDFGAYFNAPIYSAHYGQVVEAGNIGNSSGNYVIVKHSDSVYTKYSHLNIINVTAGQFVEKGQVVGTMGSTGNSTGTHLHFEVWHDGKYTNPLLWLNGLTYQPGGEPSYPISDIEPLGIIIK